MGWAGCKAPCRSVALRGQRAALGGRESASWCSGKVGSDARGKWAACVACALLWRSDYNHCAASIGILSPTTSAKQLVPGFCLMLLQAVGVQVGGRGQEGDQQVLGRAAKSLWGSQSSRARLPTAMHASSVESRATGESMGADSKSDSQLAVHRRNGIAEQHDREARIGCLFGLQLDCS